ncbi:MAG: hypothetical protein KDB27_05955 [Planctomycetales bacterium]|nr:hypothetical protein [Planctomycetales bacterium]
MYYSLANSGTTRAIPFHRNVRSSRRLGRLICIALLVSFVLANDSRAAIELKVATDFESVSVTGLSDSEVKQVREFDQKQLKDVFQVRVASSGDLATPVQILGGYEIADGAITFRPQFPFGSGVSITAEVQSKNVPSLATKRAIKFVRPAAVGARPKVTEIYPTADRLPENLLKFYLHFSVPMRQGNVYGHLQLVNLKTQEPASYPFLKLGEELWDPTGKRLTILFDPGRIKRGLKPREVAGPVLVAGEQYELVIDADWKSADGVPLGQSVRKQFTATEADPIQPTPLTWKLSKPKVGTTEPLTIDFSESLDHAMLHRAIDVRAGGKSVDGTITVSCQETRWSFVPSEPWQRAKTEIVCDATLEDNAGNSIGRPFEATGDQKNQPVSEVRVKVEFQD